LQLLSDFRARSALFDHLDNRFEVAIGSFQTSGNRKMRAVRHIGLLSCREDIKHPPGRIEKIA
jgi:hypothetical protein